MIYAHLFVAGCGLALLVEGHDDTGGPVPLDHPGVLLEGLLPLLEADAIHDALALACLEPSLHNVELQDGRYEASIDGSRHSFPYRC